MIMYEPSQIMDQAFWRRALTGAELASGLIPDRHTTGPAAVRKQSVTLPETLSRRLREAAANHEGTAFGILLSAFILLIRQQTQRTDVTVGVPCLAAGNRKGILPLRSAVPESVTFAELVSDTRRRLIEAHAHEPGPLAPGGPAPELLASMAGLHASIPDSVKGVGLAAVFDLDGAQISRTTGIGHLMEQSSNHLLPFGVSLIDKARDKAHDKVKAPAFRVTFTYPDRFDDDSMSALACRFPWLLETALAESGRPLAEFPTVSEAETELLLNGFDGPRRSYPVQRTLHDLFEEQARKTPERLAVEDEEGASLTYGELDAMAAGIQQRLLAAGLGPGAFVGVLAPRSARFAAAILGILKAGGVYVPLDPTYPPDRLRDMIADSRMPVVLADADSAQTLAAGASLPAILPLATAGAEPGRGDRAPRPPDRGCATDPAYMLYTSGSTGRPKGALVRHDGAVNHIFAQVEALGLHTGTAFLQSAPASSDISVWQFLAPLLLGGRIVIASHATLCQPAALLKTIREKRVTLMELVPSVLEQLLAHVAALPEPERALPSLECAMVTGEAVLPDLVPTWFRCFPRIRLANAYGPTEAADDIAQAVLDRPLHPDACRVPIGRPLANMTLYVLDERRRLVPPGAPGEICVSGICVGNGYWQRDDLTRRSFIPNPFAGRGKGPVLYATGDAGRWRPDGTLEFLGRLDNQAKIHGFRIELGEIEALLAQHPAVAAAAVIIRSDPAAGPRLIGYITLRSPADAGAIRESLKARLPGHMVPGQLVVLDSLPRLPNGKVNRHALPAPEQAAPRTLPATPLEHAIAAVWRDLLRLESVGVTDNFFEVGGHSLLVAGMHARLTPLLGPGLTVVDLFQYPTIRSLAARFDPAAQPAPRPDARPDSRAAGRRAAGRMRTARMQHRSQGKEAP